MNQFRRMSTTLGSRKQADDFVRLMEGELVSIVQAEDCEAGIKLLVDTLKKQHVGNFAMQQQLMSATSKRQDIENWKTSLVSNVRKSQEQLVEQNMSIIAEMKQVQRIFNDISQSFVGGKSKSNTSSNNNSMISTGKNDTGSRQPIIDL